MFKGWREKIGPAPSFTVLPCDGLGDEFFRHLPARPQHSLHLFPDYTMATKSVPNALRSAFAATRPRSGSAQHLKCAIRPRSIHQTARIPAITSSQARHRPILQPYHQSSSLPTPSTSLGSRTIFIQTQSTPNADVSPLLPELQSRSEFLMYAGFKIPSQSSRPPRGFPDHLRRVHIA
jgi:hypothetical protein